MSVFAVTALADLHYNAVCVDNGGNGGNGDTHNDNATTQACEWYKLRSTGPAVYGTCPDCVMITDGGTPLCNSAAGHMGGDEITYYCQLARANNTLTI